MRSDPTTQAYAELQRAFDHYNRKLFEGMLPPCLITMQREKRTYGYFSAQRFVHSNDAAITDEIAINPSYFGVVPLLEILQTLVHEMVHAWQYHFGSPSRPGYHNREWADKMVSIGLIPSDTGKEGGKQTGQKMGDYMLVGGPFDLATQALLTSDFRISWLDRFPPIADVTDGSAAALAVHVGDALVAPGSKDRSNRVKFRCPVCRAQAWGKANLKLLCGEENCGGKAMEPQ